MEQKTTRSLSKRLQMIREDREAEAFIKEHAETETLHSFFNALLAEKEITVPELIERSGISRNYIYNILSGERVHPSRDKVIAICIGMEGSFSQINKALELVKLSPLYPKDERDARIAIAVNQGVSSVTEINLMLEKNGLAPLAV